ncbi:MAG: hypothetical protein FK730_06040 [Asgard group archaeon]|nr:hypothetical protein [Asgard group archaeon]
MLNKKGIIVGIVIIFLISLNAIPISAKINVGTINSCSSQNEPVIDGRLENTVWSVGEEKEIILFDLYDQTNQMTITIISISFENTLYFGVTIRDNFHLSDVFGIVFRNSEEELIYGLESKLYTFGGKFDFKSFLVFNNDSEDGYTMNTYLDGYFDEDFGGSDDTVGKCTYNDGSYSIEFSMPYISFDSIGADLVAENREEIEIFLLYNNDSNTLFTQIREYDEDFDYCLLFLGCNFGLPLSPFSLLFGLLIVVGISTITKRHGMKCSINKK